MKRQFGLLLASVLLVFALAACGSDKDTQQDSGQSHDTILDDAEDALDDTKDAIEDAGDDIRDGVEDAGDDIRDKAEEHRDEAEKDDAAGSHDSEADSAGKNRSGSSLDQMVRNARVHDTDGFLKDGENAVTPGAA